MNYSMELLRAEVAGLSALFVCAILMGLYGFLESYIWFLKGAKLIINPQDAAFLVFVYAGAIGMVAVLFYGAPAYALLRYKDIATWSTAFGVGVIPGVAVLPFDPNLAGWLIVGGGVVALLTHLLSRVFFANEPSR
jgi:hypothetical protein